MSVSTQTGKHIAGSKLQERPVLFAVLAVACGVKVGALRCAVQGEAEGGQVRLHLFRAHDERGQGRGAPGLRLPQAARPRRPRGAPASWPPATLCFCIMLTASREHVPHRSMLI